MNTEQQTTRNKQHRYTQVNTDIHKTTQIYTNGVRICKIYTHVYIVLGTEMSPVCLSLAAFTAHHKQAVTPCNGTEFMYSTWVSDRQSYLRV
jgi:hypothetical protein